MKITNITSQESAPLCAAFDPHFPTAFGSIAFDINGVHFFASTCDRWTDNIFIDMDTMVPLIPNTVRIEVCKFFQKIWDMKEVDDITIPQLILDQVGLTT